MSVAVDKFDYKLPYRAIFGGATALTPEQFRLFQSGRKCVSVASALRAEQGP